MIKKLNYALYLYLNLYCFYISCAREGFTRGSLNNVIAYGKNNTMKSEALIDTNP